MTPSTPSPGAQPAIMAIATSWLADALWGWRPGFAGTDVAGMVRLPRVRRRAMIDVGPDGELAFAHGVEQAELLVDGKACELPTQGLLAFMNLQKLRGHGDSLRNVFWNRCHAAQSPWRRRMPSKAAMSRTPA